MVKCVGKTADGRACRANAMTGSQYCYVHAGGKVGKPRTRIVHKSLYVTSKRRPRSAVRKVSVRRQYKRRTPVYGRRRRVAYYGMTPKPINKSTCRPRTPLGHPSRKLPGGMVIPTVREYAAQFPENERAQRVQEYMMMDGCQLTKIAVQKKK